ncbi:hypothetical protein AAFF_G00391260 [Aldrovandia affinis]|uniref:Uncharacterized protein n=1 Tax=Aldrovandia affinis TaxID=143900 RepID=A0AAD7SDW8_9TELE|nr:hypothetical protein AAFF_G00391260 [Aldrovandia affinis]
MEFPGLSLCKTGRRASYRGKGIDRKARNNNGNSNNNKSLSTSLQASLVFIRLQYREEAGNFVNRAVPVHLQAAPVYPEDLEIHRRVAEGTEEYSRALVQRKTVRKKEE